MDGCLGCDLGKKGLKYFVYSIEDMKSFGDIEWINVG